jgi:hypothetical protein
MLLEPRINPLLQYQSVSAASTDPDSVNPTVFVRVSLKERLATTPWMGALLNDLAGIQASLRQRQCILCKSRIAFNIPVRCLL